MDGETKLYICDPYKNAACRKDNCYALCGGHCYKTTDSQCARLHDDGSPMESDTVEGWQRRPYATTKQRTYNDKEVIA